MPLPPFVKKSHYASDYPLADWSGNDANRIEGAINDTITYLANELPSSFVPAVVVQPTGVAATDYANIAAAQTLAASTGATTVLAPGTFRTASTISLTGKVSGYGATLIGTGSTSPVSITANDVDLSGLTIDGSSGTPSATLNIDTVSGLRLTDVLVKGGKNYGIYGAALTDAQLTRCRATANGSGGGNDAGIALHGTRITVTGCRSYSNTGNGFRIFGTVGTPGSRHVYVGCHADSNTLSGWYSTSSGANPVRCSWTDCHADSNGSAGMYSGFNLGYTSKADYKGCTSTNNTEHGFVLMDLAYVTMTDPHAEGNGSAGIRCQADFARSEDSSSGARYCKITNPKLIANATTNVPQLSFEGSCHDIVVRGGMIVDSPSGSACSAITHASYTDVYNIEVDDVTISGNSTGNTIASNITTDKRIWGVNFISGAVQPVYYSQNDMIRSTTGEHTMLVKDALHELAPATGDILWGYFVAQRTESVGNVRMVTGATPASGVTLARMGVYSVGSTGDLTQVGRTSNDTTLFAAANTGYTKALLSPFTKLRGQLYAVCAIVVGTPCTFMGRTVSAGFATEIAATPRMASKQLAKTDLPSSAAVGTLVASTSIPWMALLP